MKHCCSCRVINYNSYYINVIMLNLDFFFRIGEKHYAEMRTGVKIKRKSRINLEDLKDNACSHFCIVLFSIN